MENTKTISWIALVLSAIALVISVFAYTRDTNIQEMLTQQTAEVKEEAELVAARAQARAQLLSLRTRIEAEESADEIGNDIRNIRMDLQTAYTNTRMEAQDDYKELDRDLNELENEVRQGSANTLDTLASLIDALGTEVRYDN